ncbi:MAG TPA: hypothetical protein ENN99_00910, partial [Chloroflexi bacterium]|nr:hypothetical protein [Chloroflexota bacterium]
MIFSLFTNWRTFLFVGLLVLVVVGGFLPRTGHLLTASWWLNHQSEKTTSWQIVRRTIRVPQWWFRIHQAYRWARTGLGLGIWLFLLWHVLTHPPLPWTRLCLLSVSYVMVREIRCVLSDWIEIEPMYPSATKGLESEIEVTIDLEPILADLGDLSPANKSTTLSRQERTARIAAIPVMEFVVATLVAVCAIEATKVATTNVKCVTAMLKREL